MEGIVEIEVLIYGHDASTGDYIGDYSGKEIRLDLLSMDVIDLEDDIHGRYIVYGVLEDDIFIAAKLTKLN